MVRTLPDLTSTKVRPAVILSPEPSDAQDIIVAFISSVIPSTLDKYDLLISSAEEDFKVTGLKKDSVIKANKVLTISSSLILKRLGHLPPQTLQSLNTLLKKSLGLE